jgi:hypothetical protein
MLHPTVKLSSKALCEDHAVVPRGKRQRVSIHGRCRKAAVVNFSLYRVCGGRVGMFGLKDARAVVASLDGSLVGFGNGSAPRAV